MREYTHHSWLLAADAYPTIESYSVDAARTTPPPIPIFRADHPFVFAIRDRMSGTILFLGRMSDPTRDH